MMVASPDAAAARVVVFVVRATMVAAAMESMDSMLIELKEYLRGKGTDNSVGILLQTELRTSSHDQFLPP